VSRIQSGDLTGIHHSVVYGVSQSDAEKIRQCLFEAIDRIKKIVEPSSEEELYFLGCDFFNI
jgi:hypothetical protein